MTEKMLRGKGPLTIWKGANGGPGGHLYRGGVLDPKAVDADDRERLIREGFLDVVVRRGESFVLAEDSDTGDKGDPVTVGDNGVVPESEKDNGTVNTPAQTVADPEAETRRAAARTKLPADGSMPKSTHGHDVWVEYHVAQGGDYDDLVKQDKADLVKLAQQRQQ
ncbi:hypothetical protein ACH4T9_12565 [Micromonospora sp. NPDC020750]|uniref:hypothetical protein n=1 Tax=unclassified Micromonospora TaxID=2617518 RepID=UPI0037A090B9